MNFLAEFVLSFAIGVIGLALYKLFQKFLEMEAYSHQVAEKMTKMPDTTMIANVQKELQNVGTKLQEIEQVTPEAIMEELKGSLEGEMEKVMGGTAEEVLKENLSVSDKRKLAGAKGLESRRRKKLQGMFQEATQQMIAETDPVTSIVVQKMPIVGDFLATNPDYLPLAQEIGRPFIERFLPMIIQRLPPNVQAEVNRTLALVQGAQQPEHNRPPEPQRRASPRENLTGFE